jgi:hypothetical protein
MTEDTPPPNTDHERGHNMKTTRTKTAAVAVCLLMISATGVSQAAQVGGSNKTDNSSLTVTDSRLAQELTYEAKDKMLKDIVADISKMTDVTLRCGLSNEDWRVRDRRMNVFAKDASASSLMNSIARVMKFKWSKNDKVDPPTYRLYQDSKARLDEENLVKRQEDRWKRERDQACAKVLELLQQAGSASESELESLKTENPYYYAMGKTGLAAALLKLFETCPQASKTMGAGCGFQVRGNELPLEAQQSILDLAGAVTSWHDIEFSPGYTYPRDVSKLVLEVNALAAGRENNTTVAGILITEQDGEISKAAAGVLLPYPDSLTSKCYGDAFLNGLESKPGFGLDAKYNESCETAATSDKSSVVYEDDPKQPCDDPALKKEIDLKTTGSDLCSLQRAMAQASGLTVVSDSFPQKKQLAMPEGKQELGKALDSIARHFLYSFDIVNGTIEFRDRNWFTKRQHQIPQSRVDAWVKVLKEKKCLGLAEMAEIATLSDDQIEFSIDSDKCLATSNVSTCVNGSKEILQLYAMLARDLQTIIRNGGKVDPKAAGADAWERFSFYVHGKNPDYLKSQDAVLTLRLATKPAGGGRYAYTFTLETSDGLEPLQWTVNSPRYVEERLR